MLFPTNFIKVQAFAGSLYGIQVGTTTMAQVNNDINAAGGVNSVLNLYFTSSFGSLTTTAVATTFATNLGLTGAALEEGIAYTVARLNAVGFDARGEEISKILDLFTTLSNDATFGVFATAWNTKVGTAAAYTGTANVAIGSVTADSGGVFTLTADTAMLTSSVATDVSGTGFLTTAANTINASTRLGDSVYIEDASTTDNDVLNATLLAPTTAPTPTILNIETLNLQSAVAGGKLNMAAIGGTDTVNIGGSNSVALTGVVQDGSIEFVLNTNKAVTLEGVSASAATNKFNLAVEGAATTGGSFTLSDPDANTAVAIAEVNVRSLGETANVLNIVSVTANDYTGITALNIAGAADLSLTTDYAVKSDIDASELTGELSLNLRGMTDAAADFGDLITGSVAHLTLSGYEMTSAKSIDTTDLVGLQSVSLNPNVAAVDSISLKVNQGVDVNLIGSDSTDGAAAIVVTDASTGTADSLNVGIGAAAAVVFATVTAAGVESLTVNSTTTSATAVANTITALGASTASSFGTITVDSAEKANLTITDTFVKTGTAAATNVVSLVTSGAGDINFGTVQVTSTLDGLTNINEINLSSSGAGDRAFTIGEAGNLKSTAGSGQAAGTGVVLTGDGTGTATINGEAAILDTLKVNGTAFSGTVAVSTAATTGAISAANWTGVDELIYTGVRATNGVTGLGANVKVVTTNDTATLVEITNAAGVTEQTVEMAHDVGVAAIVTLTTNSVSTLNILSNDGERTANSTFTVGTLNATAATTINITAAEFAGVALTNTYTTLTPAVGKRDVVFNLTGDGAIDLVGGVTASALDSLTINASGEGARAVGTLTASALISGATLNITGDQDLLIDAFTIVAADGETVLMDGSGDVTITATTATTIAGGATLTFDLTSAAGGETVTFTDASTIGFLVGGSAEASTLILKGNKDVVIGSNAATALVMGRAIGAANSDNAVLDASDLSGSLTAFIEDNAGVDGDIANILLGTGETTLVLSGAGVSDARVVDDAIFNIKFNTDGVADTSITGFLSGDHDDILTFAGFGFGTAGAIATISSTRVVVENTANVAILQVTDVGDDLEITSLTGAFEGTITLVGISAVAGVDAANFIFG